MRDPDTSNQRLDPSRILRRNLAVLLTLSVIGLPVLCCVAYWWYHETFVVGIVPGPTFVEDLRSGSVTSDMVTKVEILKYDAGGLSTPRREEGYAQKARVSITSTAIIDELMEILETSSTEGHTWRNHPTSLTSGYLRMELADGRFYYIRYYIGYYEGEYYTTLDVNSARSTNILGAEVYENIPLGGFLR